MNAPPTIPIPMRSSDSRLRAARALAGSQGTARALRLPGLSGSQGSPAARAPRHPGLSGSQGSPAARALWQPGLSGSQGSPAARALWQPGLSKPWLPAGSQGPGLSKAVQGGSEGVRGGGQARVAPGDALLAQRGMSLGWRALQSFLEGSECLAQRASRGITRHRRHHAGWARAGNCQAARLEKAEGAAVPLRMREY